MIKHVLWTGGLDSTFMLLYEAITHNEIVQPVYIIDRNRKSYLKEIDTIFSIYNLIKEHAITKNILPIEFIDIDEINISTTIAKNFEILKNISPIGSQYLWISSFLEMRNIKMCV